MNKAMNKKIKKVKNFLFGWWALLWVRLDEITLSEAIQRFCCFILKIAVIAIFSGSVILFCCLVEKFA